MVKIFTLLSLFLILKPYLCNLYSLQFLFNPLSFISKLYLSCVNSPFFSMCC